jgi:hypothetical protein
VRHHTPTVGTEPGRPDHKNKRSRPAVIYLTLSLSPLPPSSDSNYHRVGESIRVFRAPTKLCLTTGRMSPHCNRKEGVTQHADSGDRTRAARAVSRQCFHKTNWSGPAGLLVNIPICLTPSHYQKFNLFSNETKSNTAAFGLFNQFIKLLSINEIFIFRPWTWSIGFGLEVNDNVQHDHLFCPQFHLPEKEYQFISHRPQC